MFIFYDTETSGLDRDFSQILQIALVFTDDDLNILSSKKVEAHGSPWVVPSPGALLTTGFSPDDLKNNKLSTFDMMKDVESWARGCHWPVIFSGYNTLGYDEQVLAQNLQGNLLSAGMTVTKDPATKQSNGRSDILTLVRAAAVYMPGVLTLKNTNERGTISMSLGNVAQQNGVALSGEDAHDAMNDIKATIGVAKLIQKAAPALWEQLTKLSTPEGVDEFLSRNKVFSYNRVSYGKSAAFVAATIPAGQKNGMEIMFDLSIDPAVCMAMTVEELKNCLGQAQRGYRGPKQPLLLADKNSQPILMPMDQAQAVTPYNYDEKLYATRADSLKKNAAFQQRLAQAATAIGLGQKPVGKISEQNIGVLLAGPVKDKVDAWLQEFHAADSWEKRATLAQGFIARFAKEINADPTLIRFAEFAERVVFEHAPDVLSADKQHEMKSYIARRVLDANPNAPYMTVAKARKELAEIEQDRATGKDRWKDVTDTQIRSLKLHYTAIEKEYAPYLAQAPANDDASAPRAESSNKQPPANNNAPKA